MTLPRTDCLISFAGDTDNAYPLMLQMTQAIGFYPPSLNRQTDIAVAKGHAFRVFNQMRDLIHDLPRDEDGPGDPAVTFLFGGSHGGGNSGVLMEEARLSNLETTL